MTSHALEAGSLTETAHGPRDAQILQKAIRDSVSTSPEAFLKTVDDVDGMAIDYWQKEIESSTWAVIQRGGEAVGIAVSRFPDHEIDSGIDRATTRFIESVWIAPELRGRRMGERLVRFLIEMECRKSPDIRQFLLWVFMENYRARRLYERMGFVDTGTCQWYNRSQRMELKYRLTFETALVKATRTAVSEAARREDLRQFGVSYRVLGVNTS